MSTRLPRRLIHGRIHRKKGNTPYKYYLTREELLKKRDDELMTDWNKEVQRAAERAIEAATAVIRKDGPKSKPYCVYSEKGRKFGC